MSSSDFKLDAPNPFSVPEIILEVRQMVSDYQNSSDDALIDSDAIYITGLNDGIARLNLDLGTKFVFGNLPVKFRLPLKWLCASHVCTKRGAQAANIQSESTSTESTDGVQEIVEISSPGFSYIEKDGDTASQVYQRTNFWLRQGKSFESKYTTFLHRQGSILSTQSIREDRLENYQL